MTTGSNFPSQLIPLAKLVDCPLNGRRIDPEAPELRELGASLATRQEVDLIVRPVMGGTYEVLDGKRRVAAARAVGGITELWCQVREPCSDADALQIIIVTQLHRQGLDPLAEAALVAQLLTQCATLEAAAAILGRPASWVARRAKLIDLHPVWRDGIAAGKFARASVAHLEHVARLPAEVQRELAAAWADSWNAPDSVTAFANEIRERYLHTLRSAPWKLDDLALLPTATACTACPKRSNNQTSLFADQVDEADRCLDAVCWAAKLDRHNAAKARQLASKHAKVLVLTHYEDKAQPAPADLPEQAVVMTTRLGLDDCRKTDDGAMPAIDAETGKTTYVKLANWAPPATREALGLEPEKPAKTDAAAPKATATQKREAKRLAWRIDQLRDELATGDPPSTKMILAMYAVFVLANVDADSASPLDMAAWKAVRKWEQEALDDLSRPVWAALVNHLSRQLDARISATALPSDEAIAELEELAGLDPSEQATKSLAEIPEPQGKQS